MLKRFACIYLYYLLWTNLFFHHGVRGIWILERLVFGLFLFGDGICPLALHHIALHCMAWHLELCREPMVATVPVQHRLLGITMQLHTLSGMKAGVHMYPYAYSIIGLA